MAGFVGSENIQVFPCGRRAAEFDLKSRITTEYNLVSIINRLVDKESFIVTDVDFSSGIATNDGRMFSFNIGGYLFTTTPEAIFSSLSLILKDSDTNIFAYIGIETTEDNNQALYELASFKPDQGSSTGSTYLDTDSEFVGVAFDTSAPTSSEYLSLKLFEKRSDMKWYFVEDSKIKFETNKEGTHRSVRIDDGELS